MRTVKNTLHSTLTLRLVLPCLWYRFWTELTIRTPVWTELTIRTPVCLEISCLHPKGKGQFVVRESCKSSRYEMNIPVLPKTIYCELYACPRSRSTSSSTEDQHMRFLVMSRGGRGIFGPVGCLPGAFGPRISWFSVERVMHEVSVVAWLAVRALHHCS